jgi:hypothetical protein
MKTFQWHTEKIKKMKIHTTTRTERVKILGKK